MNDQAWTVAQAKAKFSEVLDRALSSGPQKITRNGKDAAIVVSCEEWNQKTGRVGSLSEFFANSPLRGENIDFERLRGGFRKVDLG